MKFENPDWRFESPGPLTNPAYYHFFDWAKRIASQGRVQDILEDFKWRYSNGTTGRSSSAQFAEHDLSNLMQGAAKNAPLFIDAFVSACADLQSQALEVPSVTAINRALTQHNVGYQIQGDTLVAPLGGSPGPGGSAFNARRAGRPRCACGGAPSSSDAGH